MRKPPPEVAAVLHQGIRWEVQACRAVPALRPNLPAPAGIDVEAVSSALSSALVKAMRDKAVDPYQVDPEWVRDTLKRLGVEAAAVDWMVERIVRTNESIERYRQERRRGGVVAAWDEASNRRLFEVVVYPDLDVFITDLSIEDGLLLVRDQQRRVHSVDLETRQVIASRVDPAPTETDRALELLASLPDSYREGLGEDLVRLKSNLDRGLFAGFGMARRDDGELEKALNRLLGGLEPLARRHPLLQRAYQAGASHAELVRERNPQADSALYGWFQNELAFLVNELCD